MTTSSDDTEAPEPLAGSGSWSAYAENPTSGALAALLPVVGGRFGELLDLLEIAFVEKNDWHVAQHLTLFYLGAFGVTERCDIVRALYFAMKATELSKGDPRARLALARVHWARRIPLAVTYEVDLAEPAIAAEVASDATQARRRDFALGECANLRGMALAYTNDPQRAFSELQRAERVGALTVEAALQYLFVAESDDVVRGRWAAQRLLPVAEQLSGRAQGRLVRAWRRSVVALLHARKDQVEAPGT